MFDASMRRHLRQRNTLWPTGKMKLGTTSNYVCMALPICIALLVLTVVYYNIPGQKSRWNALRPKYEGRNVSPVNVSAISSRPEQRSILGAAIRDKLDSFDRQFKTHNVIAASKKWGEKFGYLKPKDHYVVPNIAHFIWFSCHPFKFEHLISMLSAHRVMKAEKIYFYTDCEPSGEWWAEAKELIPTLHVETRSRPTKVFNKNLNPKWPEHSADVARLQILMERGGVYLDTDVFVVAPLEPLRFYDYVVGRPESKILNNGVILASKHSQFLKHYYKSYEKYNSKCWACSSVRNQHTIAMKHKHLLHIEPHSMINPPYTEWKKLFLNNYNWKVGHFTIHVWFRKFRANVGNGTIFNPDNIRRLNTAVGEMCRYIYYGSPDIF